MKNSFYLKQISMIAWATVGIIFTSCQKDEVAFEPAAVKCFEL
jgi:hypothetical protein